MIITNRKVLIKRPEFRLRLFIPEIFAFESVLSSKNLFSYLSGIFSARQSEQGFYQVQFISVEF